MLGIIDPIDSSDLKDLIPPGEDIIISIILEGFVFTGSKKTTYDSHVLITERGIYWTRPKKNEMELNFKEWMELKAKGKLGLIISLVPGYGFQLKKKPNEKYNSHVKRNKEFYYIVSKIRLNSYKKWLERANADPTIHNKEIKKIEKIITQLEKNQKKFLSKS